MIIAGGARDPAVPTMPLPKNQGAWMASEIHQVSIPAKTTTKTTAIKRARIPSALEVRGDGSSLETTATIAPAPAAIALTTKIPHVMPAALYGHRPLLSGDEPKW